MTLIKQFVQAMVNQDSVALSKCFSSTAIFVDYCPKDAGQPQLHAYGPEGIDMFFRNRFLFKKFQEKQKAKEQAKPDPDADYVDENDYGYDESEEFMDDDDEDFSEDEDNEPV